MNRNRKIKLKLITRSQTFSDEHIKTGLHSNFAVIKYDNDQLGDANSKFYLLRVTNSCERIYVT